MIRQERRFSIRKLQKELKQIKSNRSFNRIINDETFARLSPEEITLLKDHTHTNKKLQAEFDFGNLLLARVKEIEKKIRELISR
jgi:exosome complex RNA-binding protein Rrp4